MRAAISLAHWERLPFSPFLALLLASFLLLYCHCIVPALLPLNRLHAFAALAALRARTKLCRALPLAITADPHAPPLPGSEDTALSIAVAAALQLVVAALLFSIATIPSLRVIAARPLIIK